MATNKEGGHKLNGSLKWIAAAVLLIGNGLTIGISLERTRSDIRANTVAIQQLSKSLKEKTDECEVEIKEVRSLLVEHLKTDKD